MNILKANENGTSRITVEGDLTVYTAAGFKKEAVDELLNAKKFEIDLSRVEDIDSAGMQILLAFKLEAERMNTGFCVKSKSPAVSSIIEMFHLSDFFEQTA
jgi:anti-anti-sigma factor